jgi:hypothetical protein
VWIQYLTLCVSQYHPDKNKDEDAEFKFKEVGYVPPSAACFYAKPLKSAAYQRGLSDLVRSQ